MEPTPPRPTYLKATPQSDEVRPAPVMRCFRVVWISHTPWTIDVWADTPDEAIQAVCVGVEHEAIRIVGVIDLATNR